jgi:hypothetical protein
MPQLITTLAQLVLGAAAAAAYGGDQPPEAHELKFSVKADLGLANQIDAVLARVAQPTEVRVPADVAPTALLERLCGNRAPKQYELITREEAGVSNSYVRFQPCLKEASNLTARVSKGDTLEAIAVRFGMRSSSVDELQVRDRAGEAKTVAKGSLAPGDVVVAPKAPAWTHFTSKPGAVQNRAELVKLFANEIGCGAEDPENCLTRRSILVTEERPAHQHKEQYRTPALKPQGPAMLQASASLSLAPIHASFAPASGARFMPLAASAALQPNPPPVPATAPVDSSQWPYDADLVEKILLDAAANEPLTPRIFIGVAENGLADKYGRPLANAAFINEASDQPLANGLDDDGNSYTDDWIGAGVLRGNDEIMASGDVSLCPTSSQVYSSWQSDAMQRMSHGSVVASIAAGGNLRAKDALAPILPRLIFFRMAKSVCEEGGDDGSGEQEAIAAVDYLVLREAKVLNLSFFSEGASGQVLRDRLMTLMRYEPPLLVLPAGNYISGNLDETGDCPACLGNATRHSDQARLTLVVGSATSDRRISDYSGYGVHTVKIFAPGEPIGSYNLAGQPADAWLPATSYAAPRVSFAAGLIQSLGIRDIPKVRSRLLLSTWPLHPDNQSASDGSGGILDLVKAAAVRHHSVEVVQSGADGALVRRTFVGKISDGLEGACPGQSFSEASIHAVRFGEPDGDGWRKAHITYRQVDPSTREPRTRVERCKSSGTLTLDAIRDGQQSLGWGDIRLVLFKAKYP